MILYLALFLSFIGDVILKHLADTNQPQYLVIPSTLFALNSLVWFSLFRQEKYLNLATIYLLFSMAKDLFICQVIAKEHTTPKELIAFLLASLAYAISQYSK